MKKVRINDFANVIIKSRKPFENLEDESDKIELSIGNLINVKITIGMKEIFIWYKVTDDGYIIGNNNSSEDNIENNDILEGIYCCLQSNRTDVSRAKQAILKLVN